MSLTPYDTGYTITPSGITYRASQSGGRETALAMLEPVAPIWRPPEGAGGIYVHFQSDQGVYYIT